MKKLVTAQFRTELQTLLPNIKTEAEWELLRTAIFSTYICKKTGGVRFGAEEIARAYDTEVSTNFKAGQKLRDFLFLLPPGTAQIVLVDGKEWKFTRGAKEEGFQRRVIFTWPEAIQKAIDKELTTKVKMNEKVYFVSGLKKNADKERALVKESIEDSLSAVAILETPAAMYMASYLNELPTNSFTKLLDNADLAFDAVNKIESEVVKTQQLKILNAVLESPKPIYRPSKNGRTDRLFGTGANLTNLKKEVRMALTKDWVEFDLQSSQLAIVAHLWNIKPLHDFLSSETSIWTEMYKYFNIENANIDIKKAVKKSLKERIYGIVYGESRERIINGNEEDEGLTVELARLGISEGGLKFVNHPLMKEVLKARQIYMKSILEEGSVEDAYGTMHRVDKENVLSIMSRVAQSYEQLLIYGVFELTNENNSEWSIVLLQHDGVSIKFHDESRKEYWIKKICDYVDSRCKDFNIPSKLVYELTEYKILTLEEEIIESVTEIEKAVKKTCEELGTEFYGVDKKKLLDFEAMFKTYQKGVY